MKFEAAPYIYTIGDETTKKELYAKFFEVECFANLRGEKPVKGYGFLESDNAFAERLELWQKAEDSVLFEDWTCKDMRHFHVLRNAKENIDVVFYFNSHYIVTMAGKEYAHPSYPMTIDDLINDFKRLGVKLYWKESIVEKYGIENVTSFRKVIEYHKIIKDANRDIR